MFDHHKERELFELHDKHRKLRKDYNNLLRFYVGTIVVLLIVIIGFANNVAYAKPPIYSNKNIEQLTFNVTCYKLKNNKVLCVSPYPDVLKDAKHGEMGNNGRVGT